MRGALALSDTSEIRPPGGAWTGLVGKLPRDFVMRPSGRARDELRAVTLETGGNKYAEGSCLVSFGDTRVRCTSRLGNALPPFLRRKGLGAGTAE